MPVQILCPNPGCDASYSVVDENLGKLGRCKKCGTKFPLFPQTRGDVPPPSETDIGAAPKSAEPGLPSPFGHYEILRTLGRGGMGAVYLALDTKLERRVALKVPHREFAQNQGIRDRFLREARAAARFHHPNFCPIHEVGETDGLLYLTMAYIEGGTLASKLERGRPWDPRRAAEVVRTLARALAEAHRQGIVHRDLKPANIMIDARGGLVIMDFGLARRFEADDPTLTATGAVLGTALYMAPEQAAGHINAIGPACDVYSLGVILYELLTGRRPFEGPWSLVIGLKNVMDPDPPSVHRPGLGPSLNAICLKAIAKEIEGRYPSMDDFAGALDDFLKAPSEPIPIVLAEPSRVGTAHRSPDAVPRSVGGAHPTKGSPPGPSRAEGSPPGRSWIVAVVSAIVAVLVVLGVIIYVATDKGRIKIDISDANAVVKVDGQQVLIEGLGGPITLRTGEHELSVKRGDGEFETRKFAIRRGDNLALLVEYKSNPPKQDPPGDQSGDPVPPAPIAKVDPPTPTSPKPEDTLITNTIGMKLKLIPAGEFLMGSDESDSDASGAEKVAGKKHLVRITRPFYLGTTEVTVGQFRRFVESAGYKTEAESDGKGGDGWDEQAAMFSKRDPKYTWRSPGFAQTDDHPVVNVSWNDAMAFCDWLGKQEVGTYRLPTEAEWEYGCRAGRATRYWSGNDPETLATVGNVADGTLKEKYPTFTNFMKAKDGHIFHQNPSAPYVRMRSVCTTCMATCGNGAPIGMIQIIIRRHLRPTR